MFDLLDVNDLAHNLLRIGYAALGGSQGTVAKFGRHPRADSPRHNAIARQRATLS